jgi:hypothetical protein
MYASISAVGIIAIALFFAYFYRNSLRDRLRDERYGLIEDEESGDKITRSQKNEAD